MIDRKQKLEIFISDLNKLLTEFPNNTNEAQEIHINYVISTLIKSSACKTIFGDYFNHNAVYKLKKTIPYTTIKNNWRGQYISNIQLKIRISIYEISSCLNGDINIINHDLSNIDYESLNDTILNFNDLEKIKFNYNE